MASTSLRRSNVEIIASILKACRYGTNKTRAMYQCNMNFKQFEDYLDLLLKANLLVMENHRRYFMLTVSNKGKCFLNTYNNMKTMME